MSIHGLNISCSHKDIDRIVMVRRGETFSFVIIAERLTIFASKSSTFIAVIDFPLRNHRSVPSKQHLLDSELQQIHPTRQWSV